MEYARAALERARARLDYARKQRQRCEQHETRNPGDERRLRKLKEGELKAERDIDWIVQLMRYDK
jgi:sRNA-binding protein